MRKPGVLQLGGGRYCRTVTDHGYVCCCCGEGHEGLPFAYGPDAPSSWHDGLAGDESSVLEQELCIIQAEHFFVRSCLIIPVHDANQDFARSTVGHIVAQIPLTDVMVRALNPEATLADLHADIAAIGYPLAAQ
jgi:hypothetical protein